MARWRPWKRYVGWYFIIGGSFALLNTIIRSKPITDIASAMPVLVPAAFIGLGWWWVVTNPKK